MLVKLTPGPSTSTPWRTRIEPSTSNVFWRSDSPWTTTITTMMTCKIQHGDWCPKHLLWLLFEKSQTVLNRLNSFRLVWNSLAFWYDCHIKFMLKPRSTTTTAAATFWGSGTGENRTIYQVLISFSRSF
jgi:hypothetical protein